MDAAESLLNVPRTPRVHVVGQLSIHSLDSLPFPIIIVFFFACLTFLFRWPASIRPILPTNKASGVPDRLVPLPSSPRGEYVYLDKPSRQLVVSTTPLLPPSPPKVKKARPNQLKRLLLSYRPLGPVPEERTEVVDVFGPESPV